MLSRCLDIGDIMEPNELLSILERAALLKKETRHCYTDDDRRESVADHSWRMALMAMLLSGVKEFQDVDMDRVIRMCLIHDLGETFTGDIPVFKKEKADESREEKKYLEWVSAFPSPQKEEWLSLLDEMMKLESREARTYKAIDKLEALIAHDESDISTWLPLEYELQLTYGRDNTAFSPYLSELRKLIDQWTHKKINDAEKQDRIGR